MKDPDEPRDLGVRLGDIIVIGLAAVFALGGFYLMIGPSPLAPLFEARKHQAQAAEKAPPPEEPGEVNIDLKTYKPPPQE